MGCVASIVFSSFGAAYGTAKSSAGVFSAGILRPDMAVRSTHQTIARRSRWLADNTTDLLPGIFSGILAIYGLVAAVLIAGHIDTTLSLYTALANLGSGLAVGLSSLAAGFTLGIVGDAGTRSVAQQPRMFVSMMLLLIFAEVLGELGKLVAELSRPADVVNQDYMG